MRTRSIIYLISVFLLALGPHRAAAQDWTGGYAGFHAGTRWIDIDFSAPAYVIPDGVGGEVQIPARNESFDIRTSIVGVHAGYNTVIATNWLFGFETDWSGGRGDKSRTAEFSTTTLVPIEEDDEREEEVTTNFDRFSQVEIGWQGTIRTRTGIIDGDVLYYSTAGIAFMKADWSETIQSSTGASSTASKSDILTGIVVGAGVEGFIGPSLLGRVEYLYEDFGTFSVPLPFTTSQGELDLVVQKVRVGLSMKF